ncbi:MAG: hypothetical protein P8L31_11435, partial [Pseudomonadales bacterium]|nr:hypothetical protein [Pseudomonadales bacterium]
MKRLTCLAASLALAVQAWAEVDTVFVSNHVLSMNGGRSAKPLAVAVTADRISWVGAINEIDERVGNETKVVQLGDQALLPGFIDAHGHASFLALTTQLANISSPPV